MNISEILSKVDHTVLAQNTTLKQIKKLCDEAIEFSTASVCVPPCYVKQARNYLNGKIAICTVIGFPNGYSTTAVKVFEAQDAIKNGADEIDMVINIGWLKDKKYADIENEIKQIKQVCQDKILKVIVETCMLTDDEKKKMCEIIASAGADYIKTSTGFGKNGATLHDIELFAENVRRGVKIKASGGISTLDDAQKFIDAGADRLGTSK
ncbi:MAG TPA: deoxyribose-phosphate aldolase, partial [Ruminococcaceae bacterium]|nr:deoxyribose-phosphate aldolase [Oscillospiraceae bacterium]